MADPTVPRKFNFKIDLAVLFLLTNVIDTYAIVFNEELHGQFRNLSDVVVTLFQTKTSKTQGRLTTTTVFLCNILVFVS
jgi:hypothetical protein